MLNTLRRMIPLDSGLRLSYHYMRGLIASLLSGNPAKNMIVIGVTGTKGKTTVTNLIASGLQSSGKKVAMISTANMMIDGVVTLNDKKMTSLDPFEMWNFLNKAKKAGCTYAVVETSSHAIAYHRVYGLRFDVAVLSNISHDHLDLHKTMENYVNTKLQLFKSLYKYGIRRDIRKAVVVNVDSEYAGLFTASDVVADSKFTYSVRGPAQVRAQNMVYRRDGTEFDVKMPSELFHIETRLLGEFNVSNVLAAICVFVSQQMSIPEIQKAVEGFQEIAGRMERVPNPKNLEIYVDYAHTEDSLRAVLETLKKMYPGRRILTVFGATGDRDRIKRPKMGEVVDTLSDVVIVTDDDTYGEDSIAIIREVVSSISRKEGENYWIIPSREDAIRTALIMMRQDDILLIAGKGSETVQVTQKGKIPWNDRLITERLISEIEKQELQRGKE